MASIVWPASLPTVFLKSGWNEEPPDNLIRQPMEAGPAKVRRRSTSAPRPFRGSMRFTATQLETFDGWYINTLKDGALRFEMPKPRTGATVDMRFVGPPKYTPGEGKSWVVSMDLEIFG